MIPLTDKRAAQVSTAFPSQSIVPQYQHNRHLPKQKAIKKDYYHRLKTQMLITNTTQRETQTQT